LKIRCVLSHNTSPSLTLTVCVILFKDYYCKKEECNGTYINSLTAIPPGQVRDAEDGGEEVEQGPGNDDAVVDV
jgi:hypothetical protein